MKVDYMSRLKQSYCKSMTKATIIYLLIHFNISYQIITQTYHMAGVVLYQIQIPNLLDFRLRFHRVRTCGSKIEIVKIVTCI